MLSVMIPRSLRCHMAQSRVLKVLEIEAEHVPVSDRCIYKSQIYYPA